MPTIYCTFSKPCGWRVALSTDDTATSIGIDDLGFIKYLFVPAAEKLRNGRFCNPAKIALHYMYEKAPMKTEPETLVQILVSDRSVDFHQLGMNARLVLADDSTTAESVLEQFGYDSVCDSNHFWDGYLHGIDQIVSAMNTLEIQT